MFNFLLYISWKHTKRLYFQTTQYLSCNAYLSQSIFWDAWLIWHKKAFLHQNKFSFLLWICEYLIIKRVNSLLFEPLSCFLKCMDILKGFDFFLDFKKGVLLKSQLFFISLWKRIHFPKYFLKGGQIWHARTYMYTHCSNTSHHIGQQLSNVVALPNYVVVLLWAIIPDN